MDSQDENSQGESPHGADWRAATRATRRDAQLLVMTSLERHGGVEGRIDYMNSELKADLKMVVALENRLRGKLARDISDIELKRTTTDEDRKQSDGLRANDPAELHLSEARCSGIDRMLELIQMNEYGIQAAISMLQGKGYQMAIEDNRRPVDLEWQIPEESRILLTKGSATPNWQPANYRWDEKDLHRLLVAQIEAYEDTVNAQAKTVDDLNDTLSDLRQQIWERSTAGNSRENTREAEGTNSQAKTATPEGVQPEEVLPEEKESDDDSPDRELLYGSNPDGIIEPLTALRRVRDTLHTKLEAAEVALEESKAIVLRQSKDLLRRIVYGPEDLTTGVVEACDTLLKEDRPNGAAPKLFDRTPAVAMFAEFEPMLVGRTQGKWMDCSFQIMLTLVTCVDRPESLMEENLYNQLAWFTTGVHRVKETKHQHEINALNGYIKELLDYELTGLAAAMRTMIIANICQRGGPNIPFFQMFEDALERNHINNIHPFASWTVLEEITFVWLCAAVDQWPAWLSEDRSIPRNKLLHLTKHLLAQRSSCYDFCDVLLLCEAYIAEKQDVLMLKLEGDALGAQVMIILCFPGTMGESIQCIWVRDKEGKVCFWDKSTAIFLEAFNDQEQDRVGWKVRLMSEAKTTAWFTMQDTSMMDFFEKYHRPAIIDACERFKLLLLS